MGLVPARGDDSIDQIALLLRRVDELERLGASRWGPGQPRVEVRLRRAATQAITTGTITTIAWDTEDVDPSGFASGSTVTIPTGQAGVYAITLYVDLAFAGGGGVRTFSEIDVTSALTGVGLNYRFPATNEEEYAGSVTLPLAVADSFICRVFHAQGTTQNLTKALLEVVKVSN